MKLRIPSSVRPTLVMTALAASLLAGCASTAQYQERVAPLQVPGQYREVAGGPERTVETGARYPERALGADPWWQPFGDERLNRLVQQVLSVNSDLAVAGLNLRKARLQAGLSGNDLWPQASGSVDASGSRAIDRHDAFDRSYSASAAVSWEVDLWGKLRAQRDVDRWEAVASAEDLQNTALALVGEVCDNYWQLAYQNQSISAGEKNLQQLQKTLELVQLQYQAGAVSGLEVREAEQNLQSERASLSALIQSRVETRNAITVLLDGQQWSVDDEPQNLDEAQFLPVAAGLPAELLGRRPDLRAAELRLRGSLASIQATVRSYYPALSLTGSVGSSSTSLSEVLHNPVAALGAGLTLPFLNLREMRFNTAIAGTNYEIAATEFRTTLYSALADVDSALAARDHYQVQTDALQRSYAAAVEIERRYEIRYRAGSVDLRTWLDAQRTLRQAELALAQARRDQLINDVTLTMALGGSAQTPADASTAQGS